MLFIRGYSGLRTSRNICFLTNKILKMSASTASRKAAVLGVYTNKDKKQSFTKATEEFLNTAADLKESLPKVFGPKFSGNRILFDKNGYDVVCFTNLGAPDQGYDELEDSDLGRESVRTAIFKALANLTEHGVTQADIDGCGDPQSSAEGAFLSQYYFDDYKKDKKERINLTPLKLSSAAQDEWDKGRVFAEAQNLARWLKEHPANLMTPTRFAEVAQERLGNNSMCQVNIRNKEWISNEKMNTFLAVAKGSVEPPVFLEVHYNGVTSGENSDKHVALVGKGVTFDSGGISIKPSLKMDAMRADMGGAAVSLAAVWAVAQLKLPVNVKVYLPLCENMPSGTATKPGDVVVSRSGKSVQIDNTDAEGRLILADALHYACELKPSLVIDSATLTGAMAVALGGGATGVFSLTNQLWNDLHESGQTTGDRMWRMPLFKLYQSHINKAPLADLNNIGGGGKGGACTAAAFLHEFVNTKHWAHLDIAGVMENTDHVAYLSKGMSGRPTRTLVEFLSRVKLSNYC